MPRKGMNKPDFSKGLHCLTGFSGPRISAAYRLGLSNLFDPSPGLKRKAPAMLAGIARASHHCQGMPWQLTAERGQPQRLIGEVAHG